MSAAAEVRPAHEEAVREASGSPGEERCAVSAADGATALLHDALGVFDGDIAGAIEDVAHQIYLFDIAIRSEEGRDVNPDFIESFAFGMYNRVTALSKLARDRDTAIRRERRMALTRLTELEAEVAAPKAANASPRRQENATAGTAATGGDSGASMSAAPAPVSQARLKAERTKEGPEGDFALNGAKNLAEWGSWLEEDLKKVRKYWRGARELDSRRYLAGRRTLRRLENLAAEASATPCDSTITTGALTRFASRIERELGALLAAALDFERSCSKPPVDIEGMDDAVWDARLTATIVRCVILEDIEEENERTMRANAAAPSTSEAMS